MQCEYEEEGGGGEEGGEEGGGEIIEKVCRNLSCPSLSIHPFSAFPRDNLFFPKHLSPKKKTHH